MGMITCIYEKLFSNSLTDGPVPNSRKVVLTVTNRADRALNLAARIRLPGLKEDRRSLGLVPAEREAASRLEYVVPDIHLLDASRAKGEILCEEQGGRRLHATAPIPLR